MITRDKITQLVFRAIDDINQSLPAEQKVTKSNETILFGKGSNLDSLGLVNLIVATEQIIEEEFGETIVLANEKAMSQSNSPFKTVELLVDYITLLMSENNHE